MKKNLQPRRNGEAKDAAEEGSSGFLNRWSQRKREARENVVAAAVDVVEHHSAAAPLTDADMPAIESLSGESDYAPFMSPGVSEKLRRAALRKLFHGAGFNVRDGLDDYDEDFTSFVALGGQVTADMLHQIETAAKKTAAVLDDEAGTVPAIEDTPLQQAEAEIDDDETPVET